MEELKFIEDDIYHTLTEKRPINYISGCRRTTEGMMRYILDHLNIDYGERLELGSLRKEGFLQDITTDINIDSDINYIRLYGNRASHSGFVFAKHDINGVNAVYKRIVQFFYNRINEPIPKDIKIYLDRLKTEDMKNDVYQNDSQLYLESLISVESSSNDYPKYGLRLISSICYKILIDYKGYIPEHLINKQYNNLYLEKTVSFIKKGDLIQVERIAQMEDLLTFFIGCNQIQKDKGKVPKVSSELTEILRNFTDWFYKIDVRNNGNNIKKYIPKIIDGISFMSFLITFLYGINLKIINYSLFSFIEFAIITMGVSAFVITFIYNFLNEHLSLIKNRKLFSISRSITSLTGMVGTLILVIVTNLLLHDGKSDEPYLMFFISAIVWSVSLQFSIIIKSNAEYKLDKALNYLSFTFLIVIGLVVWKFIEFYG